MSKTTNSQKLECIKPYLEQLKKGKKYQKPKTLLEDLVEIKTSYATKSN